MKRAFCIVLVLVLMLCFTSNALAFQGTVKVKTWLNLRKSPSTGAGINGYMQNGTIVTVLDTMNLTNGFYHIRGRSYTTHPESDGTGGWTGQATRTGYAYHSYLINIG